ncbi:hypothetical protein D3C72_2367880 [compost metagenome]
MSDERRAPSPSEEAFANDLPQLEAELARRQRSEPPNTDADARAMLAGLLAGMARVGRPAR